MSLRTVVWFCNYFQRLTQNPTYSIYSMPIIMYPVGIAHKSMIAWIHILEYAHFNGYNSLILVLGY